MGLNERWISCVISFFYIKPQPARGAKLIRASCVISFFYIKPQRVTPSQIVLTVALYLSSTSNHNHRPLTFTRTLVALYLSSTSNHNRYIEQIAAHFVALYLSSTSNHNDGAVAFDACGLRYIFLLHQTTTSHHACYCFIRCVISFFYIKPQRFVSKPTRS